MQITAYINSSESNVVNKQLSAIGTYNVKPTEELDIESPSFVLQYNSALLQCNYVYCSDYNRYYFAKTTTKPGGEIIIDCISDPLKSFWTQIANCDLIALRSASVGAPTLYPDNKLPVYPTKNNITSIVMESDNADLNRSYIGGFYEYVLTVIAGSPTE